MPIREIEPVLQQVVATDAVLCSDGAAAYRIASQHLGLAHRAINLSAGQRVIAGVYHIQNVNAYDSRLKGWMHRFHGVATKYLENYLVLVGALGQCQYPPNGTGRSPGTKKAFSTINADIAFFLV